MRVEPNEFLRRRRPDAPVRSHGLEDVFLAVERRRVLQRERARIDAHHPVHGRQRPDRSVGRPLELARLVGRESVAVVRHEPLVAPVIPNAEAVRRRDPQPAAAVANRRPDRVVRQTLGRRPRLPVADAHDPVESRARPRHPDHTLAILERRQHIVARETLLVGDRPPPSVVADVETRDRRKHQIARMVGGRPADVRIRCRDTRVVIDQRVACEIECARLESPCGPTTCPRRRTGCPTHPRREA